MTRSEFNRKFAATLETTDGFTQIEINDINDAVFAVVSKIDADDSDADRDVKAAFEAEFNRR